MQCDDGYLNDDSGRCAPALCLKRVSSTCNWVHSDGTTVDPNTAASCGSFSIPVGCTCTHDVGGYAATCPGTCLGPDSTTCSPSCGAIFCGSGTSCAALDVCE